MSGRSALRASPSGDRLGLATGLARTPAGLETEPTFFSGLLERPDVAAAGLLAVADVAGTRYADVGLMQRLAAHDPVVTAGGDRLRFESFSMCNGVYARFDLLREALGDEEVAFGTTNIDVNQPLRSALARVDRAQPLHLSVGPEQLQVSSLEATHVEPRVALPDRWVRGLAGVAGLSADMERVALLDGAAARRFFAALPRHQPPGPDLHVLPLPGGWRTATVAVPRSVPLPGASRVRGCERLLRHVRSVTVHRHRHGSTAWVFEVPGGRLTLALSPGVFRGFSGEGSLLTLLARPDVEAAGRRLLLHLAWESFVDPAALAAATGLSDSEVAGGLAWLAASGRLGHDLAEDAYFHRELAVDSEAVLRRNPRLTSAQRLLDSGGLRPASRPGRWTARGSDGESYDVGADGCTCRWYDEHGDSRGPCKHVLAVLIELRARATLA